MSTPSPANSTTLERDAQRVHAHHGDIAPGRDRHRRHYRPHQRVLRLFRLRHRVGAGLSGGGLSVRRSAHRHALFLRGVLAGVRRPAARHAAVHRDRPAAWPRREAHHRAVPARRFDDGDRAAPRLCAGRRAQRWLLGLFRLCQGIALGGAWDGLPSLLSLNAPRGRRGWYAMVPQLGAPLGLVLASALFAYFLALLSAADFLSWGWRYPFFVVLAINVVALFARLRLVATPEFQRLFETRELQPSPPFERCSANGGPSCSARSRRSRASRCSTWSRCSRCRGSRCYSHGDPVRFLIIEAVGAIVCVLSIMASGLSRIASGDARCWACPRR